MINPKNLNSKSINISHLLNDRMLYPNFGYHVRRRLHAAPPFLQRLELDGVLKGHEGCVNCLEWSSDGRILASGSDDLQLCLWDPFRKKRIQNINTKHYGNMFSVKFLPKHNDTLLATAAADKTIMIFDVNHAEDNIYICQCHSSRVKRLATAPDSPYIFWSAAEDGTVLQLDHREKHTCRSVLNHVRLIKLTSYIDANAEAKCVAVNPIRTELIAVGSNDPYARVYDRRMLKTVSSALGGVIIEGQADVSPSSEIPKDCVTYYCPGHISKNNKKRIEHESRAITYLTFNSTGTELLVNMGGEHIYLYDINNAEQPVFLNLPEYKNKISSKHNTNNNASDINNDQTETVHHIQGRRKLPEHIEDLKKMGNEFLENEKYYLAIRTYSEAISQAPQWPVLYLNRATAYMRRLWFGDVFAALKDCHTALVLDPTYVKAHFRLARSLLELGRPQEADECLKELIRRFPSYANNHGVLMLNKDIKENRQSTPSQQQQQQQQSAVADIFTRGEMTEDEFYWRCKAKDYHKRFIGHCNTTTDIKEANYFGYNGEFIVAGSDDGNFFIWERKSGNIHSIYKADSAIVNCVLPHPEICLLATSGIDHDVKIWCPLSIDKKPNFIDPLGRCVEDNQLKMKTDPFDISTRNAYCWNG